MIIKTWKSLIKVPKKYEYVYHNLNECDCLIVDQCSLLSVRTFLSILEVCTEKTNPVQLLFVGELCQLPQLPHNDDGSFCFCAENFRKVFPHKVTLDWNIRAENINLVNLIYEIFNEHISPDAEDFLLSQSGPLPLRDNSVNSVKLFSKQT